MNRTFVRSTHLAIGLLMSLIFGQGLLFSQQLLDTSILVESFDVLFDSDQSRIKTVDSVHLVHLIDTSQSYQQIRFNIYAHTDGDGDFDYNDKLSQKRSLAVRDFLIHHGIDSTTIQSSFFGEIRPAADNTTDIGKQRNRRATITLTRAIQLHRLTGIVVSDSSGLPLEHARIIRHSKSERDTIFSDQDGLFRLGIPPKSIFGLDVSLLGYLDNSQMLKMNPQIIHDTLEIRLTKLESGKKIHLNELFFVGNKAILLPKSNPQLNSVIEMMKEHEDVCFEVIGHVNFPNRARVKQNTFEYNLSVARSKKVYSVLSKNGIDPSRMYYTGRGNWEMIYPKAIRENQMKINRRVEIQIRECDLVSQSENSLLDDKTYNFY